MIGRRSTSISPPPSKAAVIAPFCPPTALMNSAGTASDSSSAPA